MAESSPEGEGVTLGLLGDCSCDLDGDWWMCINGRVYGPCEGAEDAPCGGVCELKGDCRHSCHGVSLERDLARPYGACW